MTYGGVYAAFEWDGASSNTSSYLLNSATAAYYDNTVKTQTATTL